MSAALGRALRAAWTRAGASRRRLRPSAKSWRAQLTELTRSGRGQQALASAGAGPGPGARKWTGWLSGDVEPSARSRAQIAAAYGSWFGATDTAPSDPFGAIEDRTHAINGQMVTSDGDDRQRGSGREPFRAQAFGRTGDWSRIRDAWLRRASDEELADLFIDDVIMEDIAEFSAQPTFPGGSYTIVLE